LGDRTGQSYKLDRETERQRDRQKDRLTDINIDGQTDRQKDKQFSDVTAGNMQESKGGSVFLLLLSLPEKAYAC